MEISAEVRFTLEVQAEDRYLTVPFELPEGTPSIEVELLGTEDVPGLTVDLGCEGPAGWRGWSGGARRRFIIGRDDATPGYIPGELEPGTWSVVLGLHTVPAEGASGEVRVVAPASGPVDHGPRPEPLARALRGSDRGLPAPEGLTWFAGDLHAHSLHSDGALSLWELANEGVASGLDFLAVTDHNTVSHHAHLDAVGERHGITLIAGQEITTARGHANAYGRIGFVDFRDPAHRWVSDVAEQGGFLSINHPVSGDCSWLHPLPSEPGGVELYHGTWYENPIDTAPLAWFARWRQDVALLGGGDFHNYNTPLRPGLPTTWIAAEDASEEALMEGLALGRTTITAGATLEDGVGRPDLLNTPVLLRQGESLLVLKGAGLVLVDGEGRRRVITADEEQVEAPRAGAPYRLEDTSRQIWALVL